MPARRFVVNALRLSCLAALGLAAAHVFLPLPAPPVLRCHVLDVSGSLFWGRVTRAESLLQALKEEAERGGASDRYALIAFAGTPLLLCPPSPSREFVEFVDQDLRDLLTRDPSGEARRRGLDPERTRIEDALDLALTLGGARLPLQIVLLTDGAGTSGDARRAALRARGLGVSLTIVPLGPVDPPEIRLVSARAPARIAPGTTYDVEVTLSSTVSTPVSVRLLRAGTLVAARDLPLLPDTPARVVFNGLTPPGEMDSLDAEVVPLRPEDDLCQENNRASLEVTRTPSGSRRVLYIGPPPPRALESRLGPDSRFQVTRDPGSGCSAFDLVILDDWPWDKVPAVVQSSLSGAVSQLGTGLLVSGGPHSLALGGYSGQPSVEAILPVWAAPDEKLGLAIVLDRSSSMGMTADGRRLKIEAARDAIRRVLPLLQEEDRLALLAFNEKTDVLLPFQRPPSEAGFNTVLRSVVPRYGTLLAPPVRKAAELLSGSGTGLRHVLVVSDGETNEAPPLLSDVARMLNEGGITLTFIVTGRSPSREALAALLPDPSAGRLILLDDWSRLESLIEEDVHRKKELVRRGPVPVEASAASAGILGNLPAPPPLLAVNRTTRRPESQPVLQGPQGLPVLTLRQSGAGRTAVLSTCLDDADWGGAWQDWKPHLAEMIDRLALHLSEGTSREAQIGAEEDPDNGRLHVTVVWPPRRENGSAPPPERPPTLQAHVRTPDGREIVADLPRVAAGRYSGDIPAETAGRYVLHVEPPSSQPGREEKPVGTLTCTVPYALEWREPGQKRAALAALAAAAGGTVADTASRFEAARPATWTLRDAFPFWVVAALALLALDLLVVTVWHERPPSAGRRP
jgi:Ca-activated chloride channel family protein